MLDKTFAALNKVIETLEAEADELCGKISAIGDHLSITQGDLTVTIHGGNVAITGPVKDLRINGKLVRFSEKP